MGGWLSPLFLLGAALAAAPWLLHRMRRPQGRRMPFSSLMFVPTTTARQVPRRRVEHRLLMLLRAAALLLLAGAFARPYDETPAAPAGTPEAPTRHVIAVDQSYSMAAPGRMAAARRAALEILDELAPGDRVGLVGFGRRARVLVPLGGDQAKAAVEAALRRLEPGWEGTDYGAALQAAGALLEEEGRVSGAGTVHLVSDMQAAGLAVADPTWRLPGVVHLRPVPVGTGRPDNLAVEELAVEERALDDGGRHLRVRARIRSWAAAPQTAAVRLRVGDTLAADQRVRLLPGHAATAAFELPWDGQRPVSGWVELDADELARDDRRYFVRKPRPQQPLWWLQGSANEQSSEALLRLALPDAADMPWRLVAVVAARLAAVQTAPAAVIAAGLDGLDAAAAAGLASYVQKGGRLLLVLEEAARPEPLNGLLAAAGIRVGAPVEVVGGARLGPVDFGHAALAAFSGTRFNDFSQLRFVRFHRVETSGPQASVLAWLSGAEEAYPGIVEGRMGAGRVLLWSAGVELQRSNLARSPRFVPLLHEALGYLVEAPAEAASYGVGQMLELPDGAGAVELRTASGPLPLQSGPVPQPGLAHWQTASGPQWAAVNIEAAESDPAPVSAAELALRFGGAEAAPLVTDAAAQQARRREWGHWLMLGLVLLLIGESAYAGRLARRQK